jgi:hypothetical protein
MITRQPIQWGRVPAPLTLVGDAAWGDYTVSVKARTGAGSSSTLMGRVSGQLNNVGTGRTTQWEGYSLVLGASGSWSLQVLDPDRTTRVLASGTLGDAVANRWTRLHLAFSGADITALIDGSPVALVTDATYGRGQVGLAAGTYTSAAHFDDLTAVPAPTRSACRAPQVCTTPAPPRSPGRRRRTGRGAGFAGPPLVLRAGQPRS